MVGFHWNGQFYVDGCLAMGARSSPRSFELLSTALQWIILNKFGMTSTLIHVMDDFAIIDSSYSKCKKSLSKFQDVCSYFGIPLAPEKTTVPSEVMVFLGIQLDTRRMMAQLPQDKVVKAVNKIDSLLKCSSCRLKEMQSLIGTLNYSCYILPHGKAFYRRLVDSIVQKSRDRVSMIKVNYECKQDLQVWKVFLLSFNEISLWSRDTYLTHNVYSDAAKSHGLGLIWGSKWMHCTWPTSWKKSKRINIEFLELYPVWVLLETFKEELRDSNVICHIDNSAIVYIVNKLTAKDPLIMLLIRKIVIICFLYNIQVKAEFIQGSLNKFADMVSRGRWRDFKESHPAGGASPVPVKSLCLPENFVIPAHIWSGKY